MKTAAEKLKDKLSYKSENAWESKNYKQDELESFSREYIKFISTCKTEREVIDYLIKMLNQKKIREKAGNTFYIVNKNKGIAIVKIGKNDLKKGVKLIVSHVDSPRLDLKQNPLYEDTGVALFKTHYYGGIKKYQWVTRPLALHGVVILKNGQSVKISIGESDGDPIFFISDLLPHLSYKVQDEKSLKEAIPGEKLNIVVGSIPYTADEEFKEKIKLNILQYLNKTYKMEEQDFLTAELEMVPAGKARDVGFDRSMIAGYGQDDRICVFSAVSALLDTKSGDDTIVVYLADKEEIGSDGNTGAKSMFLKQIIKNIFINKYKKVDMVAVEECLFNSRAISADVNGALDPDWKDVHEKRNAAILGHGVCMTKFTGSRGKAGASDANAEYIGSVRKVLNQNKVCWQMGELGKVDEGGGGTLAKFIADYGMDVVDMGPALLSMHAPMELSSKIDLFMTYKAYKVFFEKL
ncbi:MAG: aminopeptidase [Candidatus Margulisbacteria bacterium]|nr:aminopeptidase [Candidatus Margulisiibacteriota bacterium]